MRLRDDGANCSWLAAFKAGRGHEECEHRHLILAPALGPERPPVADGLKPARRPGWGLGVFRHDFRRTLVRDLVKRPMPTLSTGSANQDPSVSCEFTEGFSYRRWLARGGFASNSAPRGHSFEHSRCRSEEGQADRRTCRRRVAFLLLRDRASQPSSTVLASVVCPTPRAAARERRTSRSSL